jgi:hypothetical protein
MEEDRTTEPKVGTNPLVIEQVEAIKIVVEYTNVQNISKYIHFTFDRFQGFRG